MHAHSDETSIYFWGGVSEVCPAKIFYELYIFLNIFLVIMEWSWVQYIALQIYIVLLF